MLRSLSIRDFVIVDRMELEFSPGFTVLTGETGAGKSILIDALALVLGERADAIVVRGGAERADISAEFDTAGHQQIGPWLVENDLSGDEGACLMRRVVEASGRSRGFINGRPVTLAQLRELGEHLVDIHGQHQHQSLLRPAAQRELLDAYGGLLQSAAGVKDRYRAWQTRREDRVAFETNAAAFAAEREQLEWQLRELETLHLAEGEWAELTAEHARLAHAASLIEAARVGTDALSEGENSSLAQLNAVISRLNSLLEHDGRLREILDALEPAQIQLQDAVYSLRRYGERLELDPQRLREVEHRLDAIHSAARKYRVSPEELSARLEAARSRLHELGEGGDAESLRRLEEEARAVCNAEAGKLSAARRRAAAKLSQQVTQAMQTLAMAGGQLEVALSALPEVTSHGLENIDFLVAAHKGMQMHPLGKVASGGELSRLSLAIQTVTSRVAQVPTLIFDEVDAGIGGRVAEIVGKMLKQLGRSYQVMCITHLPQVAASADQQWQVSKTTANGKVLSKLTVLDQDQRLEEIARMLGGVKITETTRKHAAEMLKGRDQ
ncbi:MAG: DNA repair protein RecN [Betaproteobacteria bacterium]|nr:DNA repair protein RecN [Betaproteobacteria bacterium]MDH3437513.1 DNA repair protein RecN [Betaproteobacteria bacterium]